MNVERIGLMKLSRFAAWLLLAVLLALLMFGTQMPGAWKDETLRVAHLPWWLTKVAHFVLFAALAALATAVPLRWRAATVLGVALALGLTTEGLQFWASERTPTWHDVGIDLAGAVLGLLLARWKLR
jgi:VanZ family protein